jgi:hypothetical protein
MNYLRYINKLDKGLIMNGKQFITAVNIYTGLVSILVVVDSSETTDTNYLPPQPV